MTKLNLTQICTALLDLSDEDLKTVNKETVALLNHRIRAREVQAVSTLKIGQAVSFMNSRTHINVEGVVEKINGKTIKIRTQDGLWSVSPGLVKAV